MHVGEIYFMDKAQTNAHTDHRKLKSSILNLHCLLALSKLLSVHMAWH